MKKQERDAIQAEINALKKKEIGLISRIRRAKEQVITPEKFYTPQENQIGFTSPWAKFQKEIADESKPFEVDATFMEFNVIGKSKFRKITKASDLRSYLKSGQSTSSKWLTSREAAKLKAMEQGRSKLKEDDFADDSVQTSGNNFSSFLTKTEYTPLISSPFFKQLYLRDMWEQHSKCFWLKNYSVVAKAIMDIIRNFVVGSGYSVTIHDDKAELAWKDFEKRNDIQKKVLDWCDSFTWTGEVMEMKLPSFQGTKLVPIDVSTIWEKVTDPEFLDDVKFYHQQYATQYQLYGTPDAPITKYIIRQIPGQSMMHYAVNITPWEKRGRSDFLPAIIYMHYFEEYIQARLLRAKLEANMYWDVTVKGSDEDVSAYINKTESIVDSPPGSENVHNEAIERKPLTPSFSQLSNDTVVKEILGAIAMACGIPAAYLSSIEASTGTRAGALVATEPVAKKMQERRQVLERMLHECFEIAMQDAGLDPDIKREFNFPELIVEDRSKKIADVITAYSEGVFGHETMATIIAKELSNTTYDYDTEQQRIKDEARRKAMDDSPIPRADNQDLTGKKPDNQTQGDRAFDRETVRAQHKAI